MHEHCGSGRRLGHSRSRHRYPPGTTGVASEGVRARLASTTAATVFTGANVAATRHAKMRREKLSMTAWRYARVPSSRRMTVVSMCHISSARVVRRPTGGFAVCTRRRGRRQPFCRTRRYQVEGEAQTVPSRWARTASVPSLSCSSSPACGSVAAVQSPVGLEFLVVRQRLGVRRGTYRRRPRNVPVQDRQDYGHLCRVRDISSHS
jgi:hypothetical protein